MVEFRSPQLGECSKTNKHSTTTNNSIKVARDLDFFPRTADVPAGNQPPTELQSLNRDSLDPHPINTEPSSLNSITETISDSICNVHLETIPAESDSYRLQQKSRDHTLLAEDSLRMLPDRQAGHLLNSTKTQSPLLKHSNLTKTPIDNKCDNDNSGYHLRAFSENISALGPQPWTQLSILQQNIHASTLSTELITETLNYFVTCGQRISQMTKTYDDSDAYILLLQEKEVDLELAARIGQDLLKQNKQLRENIKNLEEELLLRQEEIQQLKHELSSKTTLLDTFIEEEEQQTSRIDQPMGEDDHKQQQQQQQTHLEAADLTTEQQDNWSSFVVTKSQASSGLDENKVSKNTNENSEENQKLVQSVTLQLLKNNKRLCELQDELFYRNEQSSLQQEDIRQLKAQIQISENRVNALISENESLSKTVIESEETHKEIVDELKVCKRNFSELLRAFLELQKESRTYRNQILQDRLPSESFLADLEPTSETNNTSFDSFNTTSFNTFDSTPYDFTTGSNFNSFTSSLPPTLQEEIEESMQRNIEMQEGKHLDNDEKETEREGIDITPYDAEANDLSEHEGVFEDSVESDEGATKSIPGEEIISCNCTDESKNWIGISSFMLTTLLLLCISVTFTSSSYSVTPKLPIKLDK